MVARRSGRGYLGLPFNNCLFLFGFLPACLNSVTKTSRQAKTVEKELMFKDLKFAVVAFASKRLSPSLPPFSPFLFLILEGAKQHRPGIFVKLQRKF